MAPTLLIVCIFLALAMGISFGFLVSRREIADIKTDAHYQKEHLLNDARRETETICRQLEQEAKEECIAKEAKSEKSLLKKQETFEYKKNRVDEESLKIETLVSEASDRRDELRKKEKQIKGIKTKSKKIKETTSNIKKDLIESLEQKSDQIGAELIDRMSSRWLEEAKASSGQLLRDIENNSKDLTYSRRAKQVIELAMGRYHNHFLTERNMSTLSLNGRLFEALANDDQALLKRFELEANIKMNLSDSGDSMRLEGLDGVGREIARRAVKKLHKKRDALVQAQNDAEGFIGGIKKNLENELMGLGKKAFQVLGVKKADPEIVDLVGRLNYRTSYTQNQWLHAVEASFLAGMMASELELDEKLARRSTLMHDIGKSLTHKIEGSHAVIGADIARRLGEDEIVANAIGSHHMDEPPNSVYAYLVAAADALSGARPGARREQSEGHSTKLQDLENIANGYPGVEKAFAVHGGREVRVYVREGALTDLETVDLSSDIAAQISEEMTFPGQIKVTIIRSEEAVAVAR